MEVPPWRSPKAAWTRCWAPCSGVALVAHGVARVDPEVPEPFPYFGMSSWRHHSAPGRPSYLLLLEVQELHRAHLSVGFPAGGSFSPPTAPAAIGLVGEAADPVLAGGSGAYRLRGGFNHHDLLAGPEERGGRKVEAEKRNRATPRCWHPNFCPCAHSVVRLHPVLAEVSALQKKKFF